MSFEYKYDYELINEINGMQNGLLITVSIDNFAYIVLNPETKSSYEAHIVKLQKMLAQYLNSTVIRHSEKCFFILTDTKTNIYKDVMALINNFNNIDENNIFLKCLIGYSFFDVTSKKNNNPICQSLAALDYAIKNNIKAVNYADYILEHNLEEQKPNAIPKKILNIIHNKGLKVYVRPILDNNTNEIRLYESTIETKDTKDKISEDTIISFSKEFNLISLINNISCKLIREQMAYNIKSNIIINISIENCIDKYWVSNFINKINDLPLSSRLIISLSEKIDNKNKKSLFQFIEQVRAIGCKIMANITHALSYKINEIQKINLDYINLESSFTNNIESDPVILHATKLMIDFFRVIEVKILASQVDTKEKFEIMKQLPVDYLHGQIVGEKIEIEKI